MAADPGQLSWKCYDCNMTFGNPTLLQKHKARFCVGGQLGDPDLLLLRKGLRDEDPPLPRAPPDDSDVTPRYNPNQDPKVQQLAESHGRQMEYLQSKNRELERQREEIRRRLEELGRRPAEKDNSTEELLRELREQEARNQCLLEELRKQLAEARRPVQFIQQPTERQPDKKAFIYPVYYGNSLVAEIIAVRQAYLQNGGNDPDILAQLAQMQAEAQAIDDSLKNAQKRQPKEKGSNSLTSLELENERLQRQLLLLQEQKLISTNRRKDNREGRGPTIRPTDPLTSRSVPQRLTKWVQTNPVPSDEADTSGLGQGYVAHRNEAQQSLVDRWGGMAADRPAGMREGGRAQPAARPEGMIGQGGQSSKPNQKVAESNAGRSQTQPALNKGSGSKQTHNSAAQTQGKRNTGSALNEQADKDKEQKQSTIETLRPQRLETIHEASMYVDTYDPDQPLDIDLSAVTPRRKRVPTVPYKRGTITEPLIDPDTSRSVVVKSERPYTFCDFYGRPVDAKGRPIRDEDNGKIWPRVQGKSLPLGSTYSLLLYNQMLQDNFRRSDDLLRYDPYYRSLFSKRLRQERTTNDSMQEYTPRQLANPQLLLQVPDSQFAGQLNDMPVSLPPNMTNSEAQTNLGDLTLDDELTDGQNKGSSGSEPVMSLRPENGPRRKNAMQPVTSTGK